MWEDEKRAEVNLTEIRFEENKIKIACCFVKETRNRSKSIALFKRFNLICRYVIVIFGCEIEISSTNLL